MTVARSYRPSLVALEQRTVVHQLRRGAQEQPGRVAVRDRRTALTYEQLLDRSARAGAALRGLGVGAGDTVLLMLDNDVEHVLSWFGAACAGAVEVPINTASMPPQIAFIANDCAASVLVVDERYVPRIREIAAQLPQVRHVIVRGDPSVAAGLPFTVHGAGLLVEPEPGPLAALSPGDPSGIMYTSGTTGPPKGVVVSHALTYGRNWPLGPGSPQPGDTVLVTLPIYHVIGQCRGLYNGLIAGGTVVLEERFSASRFWDVCREHDVSYATLVGVMASYLLAQQPRPDDADNPVQRVGLGTTIAEVEEFRQRFDVPELYVSYGLTEAGGVLAGPAEAEGCGYLREDFEARLVDEHDVEVGPGEAGELVLRPTEPWTTMSGYHNRPDATLERWRNLWLHTGDLMRRREDGMYVFAGRMAERIRHRGENVTPTVVEEQLLGHPCVRECAVVGIAAVEPGAAAGDNDILAAVVAEPGTELDCAELVEFLSSRVPYFAVPRFFRRLDALPRTDSTHRVQRRQIAADGHADAWDRVEHGVEVRRSAPARTGT